MDGARLTFLGTGTSQGIPIVGCRCAVCTSIDSRDKRYRSSALIQYKGLTILIDAGPDFRSQMLAAGVSHLDALLLTHNHKDHTGGLDDLRSLNYIDRQVVDIYCEQRVLDALKREYTYVFAEEKYPGAPEWRLHVITDACFAIQRDRFNRKLTWVHDRGYCYTNEDGTVSPTDGGSVSIAPPVNANEDVDGIVVVPIRGYHHSMPVLGYRFGNIAYITDMSELPDSELPKLQGLDHVTLNTVGYNPHHSHFSLEETLVLADKIGARNTWLTHLSHTFPTHPEFCREIEEMCRQKGVRSIVRPAYDGLTIE